MKNPHIVRTTCINLMKKHYLPAPDGTKEAGKERLPDRSYLTKLYPGATGEDPFINKALTKQPKLIRPNSWQMIALGVLAPLPFVLALPMLNFLEQTVNKDNALILLPMVTATILIWVALLGIVFFNISKLVDRLAVSKAMFLGFYAVCLLLIAKPLYALCQVSNNTLMSQGLFAVTLLALSTILIWFILSITLARNLPERVKTVSLVSALVICFAIASMYFVAQLRP